MSLKKINCQPDKEKTDGTVQKPFVYISIDLGGQRVTAVIFKAAMTNIFTVTVARVTLAQTETNWNKQAFTSRLN